MAANPPDGSFLLSFLLLQCKLEETLSLTDGGGNCPNPPLAKFSVAEDTCVVPCQVMLSNASDAGLNYVWDFQNGQTSVAFNPAGPTYTTPGKYEISLSVMNPDSCAAIARQTIVVRRNPVLNLPNAVPLGMVQRPNSLDFHCLYLEGSTIKSVTLASNGLLNATSAKSYFSDVTSIKAGPRGGGFIVTGKNGNDARIGVVSESQNVNTPNLSFAFQNATASVATGANSTIDNGYITTGYRKLGAINYPAFVSMDVTGSITANRSYATTDFDNFIGLSIIQQSVANFLIGARKNDSTPALILSVGPDGSLVFSKSIAPLATPTKILAINSGRFAVIGRGTDAQFYLIGLDASANVIWQKILPVTDVKDAILTPDEHIIVCGQASDGKQLYLSKINADTRAVMWTKTYADPNATINGVAISRIQSGGYIVAAHYIASDNRIYTLLIDEDGNEKN